LVGGLLAICGLYLAGNVSSRLISAKKGNGVVFEEERIKEGEKGGSEPEDQGGK
jgi:hypothetical protein